MPSSETGDTVRSVARALALLDCFTEDVTETRLSDLARQSGLTLTTTHRLLKTLGASGYLWHDQRSERYVPGPRLLRLSQAVSAADDTVSIRDTLEAISTNVGLSLGICVPSEGAGFRLAVTFVPAEAAAPDTTAIEDFALHAATRHAKAASDARHYITARTADRSPRVVAVPLEDQPGVLVGWGPDPLFVGKAFMLRARALVAGSGALQLPPSLLR